jgi:plasmid maintenance system antidote protein VapI
MRSFRLTITPKRRAAVRFVGQVRRSLQKALADNPEINQAGVARALEVDRSVVTKQLHGERDISLSRVGELAWAMGLEPELVLHRPNAEPGTNRDSSPPAANALNSSGTAGALQVISVRAGEFSCPKQELLNAQ